MAEKEKAAALTTFHKITIGSAVALGILFAIYSAVHDNWIVMACSSIITVILLLYLRWFLKQTSTRQL